MTIEQLREMHQARPFRAFRIHLADGRHFDVEHPEFLSHTRGGRTIIVAKDAEASEIIDLLLVTSLERLTASSKRSRR